MSRIQCFVLEPFDPPRQRVWLRRYVDSSKLQCPHADSQGYHQAKVLIGDEDGTYEEREGRRYIAARSDRPPVWDPRWPKACACGFEFRQDDHWQLFTRTLYRRTDTGEVMTVEDAPAGAMWNAWWMPACWKGADGRSLMVQTPGGAWCVDAQASNCTRKDDQVHKCWCRHGEWPLVTVDKDGNTCSAGAGSIQAGSYHGFLRAGFLED